MLFVSQILLHSLLVAIWVMCMWEKQRLWTVQEEDTIVLHGTIDRATATSHRHTRSLGVGMLVEIAYFKSPITFWGFWKHHSMQVEPLSAQQSVPRQGETTHQKFGWQSIVSIYYYLLQKRISATYIRYFLLFDFHTLKCGLYSSNCIFHIFKCIIDSLKSKIESLKCKIDRLKCIIHTSKCGNWKIKDIFVALTHFHNLWMDIIIL